MIDQWNGASWQPVVVPNPAGARYSLSGVSCVAVEQCIAVGSTYAESGGATLVEASWG